MDLAKEIVELFEELLDEKGIIIPCEDEVEEKDRYDGNNDAKLYGTEYFCLVEKIESLLSDSSYSPDTSCDGNWIPVSSRFPKNGTYVLVSFANRELCDMAQYVEDKEGGAFYPKAGKESFSSLGLVVNAWQPLPKRYNPRELESDVSTLLNYIINNMHWCPFRDEDGIDIDEECVGFREPGCKECMYRNIDKLN